MARSMDLKEMWSGLVPNVPKEVEITFHVSKIEGYVADPVNCRLWKKKLARKGWKRDFIFLHDLVLYDRSGFQIRVLLHPSDQSVLEGRLMEGCVIIANIITKIKVANEDLDQFYLAVNDWCPHPDPRSVQLKYQRSPPLDKYVREGRLLGNLAGKPVCPWTYSTILDYTTHHVRRSCSVNSVPRNLLQSFNPVVNNLANLGKEWTNLRSPWPLILRVYAKSKNRMIIRQEDSRKQVLQLTTVLVGDKSGFCKLIVWDEAVTAFSGLFEGDILVLGGKYKIGKYQARKPDKYYLEPKLRCGLAPVSIELKLNLWDLDNVCILDHAADVPVPAPLWNFHTIRSLQDQPPKGNRLIDITGVVSYHGRWEREQCRNEVTGFTGQFWIRTWIKLVDHTSLEDQESSGIGVRMFVSGERWNAMESLLPGCPCVITNLIYVKVDEKLSHLECSNETQVFPGDESFSSRFIVAVLENPDLSSSNNNVETFRNSWNAESSRWSEFLRRNACYGGHLLPCSHFTVSLRSDGQILRYASDLEPFFCRLPYKTGVRLLVAGCMLAVRTISVDKFGEGSVTEEILIEYNESVTEDTVITEETDSSRLHADRLGPKGQILEEDESMETFCASFPSRASLSRHCKDFTDVRRSVTQTCFLKQPEAPDAEPTSEDCFQEACVCMVLICLRDCRVWCIADIELKSQLMDVEEAESRLCIDIFRFAGYVDNDYSSGTEAVLRKVLLDSCPEDRPGSSKRKASTELDAEESSTAGDQTIDLIQAFTS